MCTGSPSDQGHAVRYYYAVSYLHIFTTGFPPLARLTPPQEQKKKHIVWFGASWLILPLEIRVHSIRKHGRLNKTAEEQGRQSR